jgi:hypothetical protein
VHHRLRENRADSISCRAGSVAGVDRSRASTVSHPPSSVAGCRIGS